MSTYAFSKPTYGVNVPANPFGVTFYVSNTTNPTEDQGAPGPVAQGRTPKNPFTTIAAAVTAAVSGRGDTIVIQRGTYTENLTLDKAGLTLLSAVPYGYPDHTIIRGTTSITASGVSAYNLEFFSNSTTAASVSNTFAGEAGDLWFENCSFASNGTTEPQFGLRIFGANNVVVRGCFFIDNGTGISLEGGTNSWPSGILVEHCVFVEQTTRHLSVPSPSQVENITVRWNAFNRGAVTPTDYVNIAAGNGQMYGNVIAVATNASASIVIPAGVLYGPNGTEAGWSTARPA